LEGGKGHWVLTADPVATGRTLFALESVGPERMLAALTEMVRDLGFCRRDFLKAFAAAPEPQGQLAVAR
jgi:hypothetical protein